MISIICENYAIQFGKWEVILKTEITYEIIYKVVLH